MRIGPRWVRRPGSTWWEYCQLAIATTTGASGGTFLNSSMPSRWLLTKPCSAPSGTGAARRTDQPLRSSSVVMIASSSTWVGQLAMFARTRESPLVTR